MTDTELLKAKAHQLFDSKKYVKTTDKSMSNGMRMYGSEPLTEDEIEFVRKEIRAINADDAVFVFNEPKHPKTCYSPINDRIYIARNVFIHPRDLSVRAVLAHEYYGHRPNRDEYMQEIKSNTVITPEWQDECRASINAAKYTPNLSEMDRYKLIQDAHIRANEYGAAIKNDEYMKEVLYGQHDDSRNIVPTGRDVVFLSKSSENGIHKHRQGANHLPQM